MPHQTMTRLTINKLQHYFPASFLRFIGVGLTNMLISLTMFQIALRSLPSFSWQGGAAQTISYSAGIVWSFFWNRKWTFQSSNNLTTEAASFIISQLGMLLISTLLITLTVDIFKWQPTLSWVLVMGIITILNFLVIKKWVFKPVKKSDSNKIQPQVTQIRQNKS